MKKEHGEKYAIGLMSGTSVDGIDAVLISITSSGLSTKYKQLGFITLPYNKKEQKELLDLASGNVGGSKELLKINFYLGKKFREAAIAVCKHCSISKNEIDFIGTSGHTFYHLPNKTKYLGKEIRGTIQLGEPSFLNEEFNCPVVSDFRVRDMVAGGQGAPLVPYTEFLLFRSSTKNIALQNIGGIGNITILPKNCTSNEVKAFDTGPGNMVIDNLVNIFSKGKLSYDKDAQIAKKGKLNKNLLNYLLDDDYLTQDIPKSTGREKYSKKYIDNIINFTTINKISLADMIYTVTFFTAKTIEIGIKNFCKVDLDTLIIGGGGSHNSVIIDSLKTLLPNIEVLTFEDIGLNSDSKEAIAFAVLANETLSGISNNLISVTGAKHPVIMGKISY
ncbi:MAG: anhydro-N-acetylmuramic acid kinase [Sphaerochaetaceae bacterium]|nr:anhydro-N-acetylmuramic acid kinase [Sphaerochaetaceae bacterium]